MKSKLVIVGTLVLVFALLLVTLPACAPAGPAEETAAAKQKKTESAILVAVFFFIRGPFQL